MNTAKEKRLIDKYFEIVEVLDQLVARKKGELEEHKRKYWK